MGLMEPARSDTWIGRIVTCTVVSVIPYMLTSRGRAVPYPPTQPRSMAGSSASPPKTTYRRPVPGKPASSAAPASCRKAVGVWLRTVTRSARRRSRNATGSRLVRYGTTTRRPPYSSGPHSSHTEKSNAIEWNRVHTSCGPKPKSFSVAVNSRVAFAWVTTTPLDLPVDPDV